MRDPERVIWKPPERIDDDVIDLYEDWDEMLADVAKLVWTEKETDSSDYSRLDNLIASTRLRIALEKIGGAERDYETLAQVKDIILREIEYQSTLEPLSLYYNDESIADLDQLFEANLSVDRKSVELLYSSSYAFRNRIREAVSAVDAMQDSRPETRAYFAELHTNLRRILSVEELEEFRKCVQAMDDFQAEYPRLIANVRTKETIGGRLNKLMSRFASFFNQLPEPKKDQALFVARWFDGYFHRLTRESVKRGSAFNGYDSFLGTSVYDYSSVYREIGEDDARRESTHSLVHATFRFNQLICELIS